MKPVDVFIALGSNQGRRRAHLDGAVRELAATPKLELSGVSTWLETPAEGLEPGAGAFLNGVVRAACRAAPQELLAALQRIEAAHGRVRGPEKRSRTLDLDLLLFGELRMESPELSLPHPRLEERVFVLRPLCELAPELRLPRCGLSVRERLAELESRATQEPSAR